MFGWRGIYTLITFEKFNNYKIISVINELKLKPHIYQTIKKLNPNQIFLKHSSNEFERLVFFDDKYKYSVAKDQHLLTRISFLHPILNIQIIENGLIRSNKIDIPLLDNCNIFKYLDQRVLIDEEEYINLYKKYGNINTKNIVQYLENLYHIYVYDIDNGIIKYTKTIN